MMDINVLQQPDTIGFVPYKYLAMTQIDVPRRNQQVYNYQGKCCCEQIDEVYLGSVYV
jgi:hypothetical protein